MNFLKKLTILIIRMGNFYSVLFPLHNLSHSCYHGSLSMPWNLQFALTEGDRRCLPVAPYWSKRLTVALGITRWQTVVLLLSTLRIQYNIGHGKFVLLVSLIVLLVVAAIFVAIHTDGRSKVSFHFK